MDILSRLREELADYNIEIRHLNNYTGYVFLVGDGAYLVGYDEALRNHARDLVESWWDSDSLTYFSAEDKAELWKRYEKEEV